MSPWALFSVGILVAVISTGVVPEAPLERDDIIEAVNNAQATWKAGRNFHPSTTRSILKHLVGAKKHHDGSRHPEFVPDSSFEDLELPKNFDLRTQYPDCTGLQTLRDQGPCGSCWAVSAASAFSDRLCIASNGSWNGQLSAENLLSCCAFCGDGCDGGHPDEAWSYLKWIGIVTGGDYNSKEGCQPYTLPACEHGVSGDRKRCDWYGVKRTPNCKSKCHNKTYKTAYRADFHFVSNPTKYSNIKSAMKDIYQHGPIQASFYVYEDFFSYKSGVYKHTTGEYLGGHAVKVIGWGVEKSIKYWLVANSWNSDWGDNGHFKILRGADECAFEQDLIAGTASSLL